MVLYFDLFAQLVDCHVGVLLRFHLCLEVFCLNAVGQVVALVSDLPGVGKKLLVDLIQLARNETLYRFVLLFFHLHHQILRKGINHYAYLIQKK